ncbi:lytic murein transglycosylase B [Halomonas sp. McH1-25]|uniref:lytic murein transglycosylase B n=1 Tax=unclassified Halomonas TaxID=2609666 RepID=UPI001EF53B8F|nr:MULTISPECIES: lytic murein transglycosylase B [unclassified Halomonas]MCG7599102.1 lytic murein transglycosylase B [Halomonas sp. McH1-25]MCP1342341.1 lytic murein transglycosylase B [Halomonas sp. FL8]MCP1360405.1 lytic murein transglycosylase B [Halomonas sp. BBD45]MCP1364559.1 lytic murein transglycosylase B [Halomonas sp. BBD48]
MRGAFGQAKRVLATLVSSSLLLVTPAFGAENFDPASHAGARALVDELASEGVDRDWLTLALSRAEYRPAVLEAMSGAAERRLRWDEYRNIFIKPERIEAGVDFIEAHREAFERAEAQYGVPPEIVAAIIGVETFYGRHTGSHRVIDSLATLAFHHPRRGDFFRGELAAFLEITNEQQVDPLTLEGSYAGAMGYPQFIPTSYQAYAVDFDGDGMRDLWHNPVDAIGSVGNYFARHGWTADAPVVSEATGPVSQPDGVAFNRTEEPYVSLAALSAQGIEPAGSSGQGLSDDTRVIPVALDFADDKWAYRLGHHNFYVITRYNHSHLYAMAVTTLAERIRAAMEGEA